MLQLLLNPELDKLLPFFLIPLFSLVTPLDVGDDGRYDTRDLSSSLVVGAACGDKVLEINQNCAETREKNNQCTLPVVRPVKVPRDGPSFHRTASLRELWACTYNSMNTSRDEKMSK